MKILSAHIILEDVRLFARHGVSKQEREVGNTFIIDLKVKAHIARATETDDLADTVSYAEIYDVVVEEMSTPSQLLEHVGGRIIARLLSTFGVIEEVHLKLSKQNPPMGADIASAGIEIRAGR